MYKQNVQTTMLEVRNKKRQIELIYSSQWKNITQKTVVITLLSSGECKSVHKVHACLFMFALQSLQAASAPARSLLSRSDILASDNCSRAAHISRVVDTSKQAARASGGAAATLLIFSFSKYMSKSYFFPPLQQIWTWRRTCSPLTGRAIRESAPSSIMLPARVRPHIPLRLAACCGEILIFCAEAACCLAAVSEF